jgi:type I restriction-modification system DNA methylase subunit
MRNDTITKKAGQEHRTELMNLLNKFQHKFDIWRVWDDMTYLCAAALSQPCQWIQAREDEYLRRIKCYPPDLQQLFPDMLAEIVLAFEQEGFADILGAMYMELNFGNARKGQYFSPYNVCRMMAAITAGDPAADIKENGYISVNDCCCGSGAMLIAFAENCIEQKINYQQNVLFVAQDVDPVVARMAFIQLTLLGMPGYVIVGNSLTNPAMGHVLSPVHSEGLDVWYTPLFFGEVWHYRRLWEKVRVVTGLFKTEEKREVVKPRLCVLKGKG